MPENVAIPVPRLHATIPNASQRTTPEPTGGNRPPLSIIKFLELVSPAGAADRRAVNRALQSINLLLLLLAFGRSLAITCTALHYYSFDDGDLVTGFLATGTFCGFIVILITIMAGYLIKAHLHRRLSIFYSLLGCSTFLTSGIFIIEAWEHAFRTRTRDLAITKGSISIINGVIFLMDTIFTFRERK